MANFIRKTYSTKSDNLPIYNKINGYTISPASSEPFSYDNHSMFPALNDDINIFTNLTKEVYQNNDATSFIDALFKVISKYRDEDICFSKLNVSEVSNDSITIEWIFNNFRQFFSFNLKEGNYYGFTSYDKDGQYFVNKFQPMTSDYLSLANRTVLNSIKAIKGELDKIE